MSAPDKDRESNLAKLAELTTRLAPTPKEEQDEQVRSFKEIYARSHNGMRAVFE